MEKLRVRYHIRDFGHAGSRELAEDVVSQCVTRRSWPVRQRVGAGGVMPAVRERVDQFARSPVFVDSSGRRRTWVKWALSVAAMLCFGYLVLLGWSFVGGPIKPGDLLPLPEALGGSRPERSDTPERAPPTSAPTASDQAVGSANATSVPATPTGRPASVGGATVGGSTVPGTPRTATSGTASTGQSIPPPPSVTTSPTSSSSSAGGTGNVTPSAAAPSPNAVGGVQATAGSLSASTDG